MDFVSSLLPFDQNIDDLFEPFSFPNFNPDDLLSALSDDFDTNHFFVDPNQNCEGISNGSKRKALETTTTPGFINKDDQNKNQNQNNQDCEGISNRSKRKAPETTTTTEVINKDDQNKNQNQNQNQNKNHNANQPTESKEKKIMHRDLERQRRQEMASLYSSIKALLPPEYLKGKRSTSDHMNQAIKYIKDQKNKIKGLEEKRDEIKTSLTSNSYNGSSVVPPQCLEVCLDDSVVVRPCVGGSMEVVITTSLKQSLPLSGVLGALIREGLTIVNCISTRADQKLLHTVVFEMSDGRVIDPSRLQKKLEEFALRSSRVDFDFEPSNN